MVNRENYLNQLILENRFEITNLIWNLKYGFRLIVGLITNKCYKIYFTIYFSYF